MTFCRGCGLRTGVVTPATFLRYRNIRLFFSIRYLFDDLATPNHNMILPNIFLEAFMMKSLVVKRSVVIDGHKTSVSLEDAFWSDLKKIAHMQQATLSKLITEIDKRRQQGNLSSALRVFVFDQVRAQGDLWRYSRSRRAEGETKGSPTIESRLVPAD